MKLKLPNLPKLTKLSSLRWPRGKARLQPRLRPPNRLHAATRRAAPAIDDYGYDEQPTTKLSSAFFVVLILHVVAVGGIYAFNSIKAHRKNREMPPAAPQESATTTRASNTLAEKNEMPLPPAPLASSRSQSAPGVVATTSSKSVATPKGVTAKTTPAVDAKKAEFVALHHNEDAAVLKGSAKSASADKTTYKVMKGDTLYSIAKKVGVSPDELMKANKIEDSKKLQIAQTLKVPAKKAE
jgi:LysM repeat protein